MNIKKLIYLASVEDAGGFLCTGKLFYTQLAASPYLSNWLESRLEVWRDIFRVMNLNVILILTSGHQSSPHTQTEGRTDGPITSQSQGNVEPWALSGTVNQTKSKINQ